MNQVLFNKYAAEALPNVDLEEWRLFLEWAERYVFRNGIENPLVVEIGTQKGRQKRFWTNLFGWDHMGIDITDRLGKPDILGDSQDPGTLARLNERLGGRPIDILYIDGDHSYQSAKKDYEIYSPLATGAVAFHDVRQDRFAVKKFWQDLQADKSLRTLMIDVDMDGMAGIGILVKSDRDADPDEVEIAFPPSADKYVWLQSNGDRFIYTNFPEIRACRKHLEGLSPKVALDLGCGLGRASVYFNKRFGWGSTRFILADGDSGERQLGGIRSGKADFYNSMAATYDYCGANGLQDFQLFNLEKRPIADLPPTIELAYSFVAVGFHWPLDFYLGPLHPKLAKEALVVFSMRGSQARDWVDGQVARIDRSKYELVEYAVDLMATRKSALILRRI